MVLAGAAAMADLITGAFLTGARYRGWRKRGSIILIGNRRLFLSMLARPAREQLSCGRTSSLRMVLVILFYPRRGQGGNRFCSINRLDALQGALGVLNPRERRIFGARRLAGDPMTLEALSDEFGISRERVSTRHWRRGSFILRSYRNDAFPDLASQSR
jgi:Sigma-70, region 4